MGLAFYYTTNLSLILKLLVTRVIPNSYNKCFFSVFLDHGDRVLHTLTEKLWKMCVFCLCAF